MKKRKPPATLEEAVHSIARTTEETVSTMPPYQGKAQPFKRRVRGRKGRELVVNGAGLDENTPPGSRAHPFGLQSDLLGENPNETQAFPENNPNKSQAFFSGNPNETQTKAKNNPSLSPHAQKNPNETQTKPKRKPKITQAFFSENPNESLRVENPNESQKKPAHASHSHSHSIITESFANAQDSAAPWETEDDGSDDEPGEAFIGAIKTESKEAKRKRLAVEQTLAGTRPPERVNRAEQVFMHRLCGKSFDWICEHLSISPDTVRADLAAEGARRAHEIAQRRSVEVARSVAMNEHIIDLALQKGRFYDALLMGPKGAKVTDRTLDTVLAARERIDKVLGIEAPTKVEIGVQKLVEALAPKALAPGEEDVKA